jgi:hypothetical protein
MKSLASNRTTSPTRMRLQGRSSKPWSTKTCVRLLLSDLSDACRFYRQLQTAGFTHKVFLDLFECTRYDNNSQRNDSGVPSRRRYSGDLLDASGEEEEQIGRSRKLG